MKTIVTVPPTATGQRIDSFVALAMDISRSQAQQWIAKELVWINGAVCVKKAIVNEADVVEIDPPEPEPVALIPEAIALDIVYEDDDLLVVNKPKGMVVHPAAGHSSGTLVHALLHYCGASLSGINGVLRPGIVHRIDKDTSGLLMVAKNDLAHQGLADQIKDHQFFRQYETVVTGHLREPSGTVHAPIGRHPRDRMKMAVTPTNSKDAITHYEVIASLDGYDHVRVTLETGRTHQIRVHMAYLGHPVAGDMVYGGKAIRGFEGQCLHAKSLGFVHPRTGEEMRFDSELPPWFSTFLRERQ